MMTTRIRTRRTLGVAAALAAAGVLGAVEARAAVTDVTTAGTLFWGFDGTDVTTDGGGVTALNNQIANSAGDALRTNLGTDGGGQAQVVSTDTGNGLHSVIDFDGADDTYLSDFGATITGRHQMFVVVRFDENSGESFNNYVTDGEDNNGRRVFAVRGTTGNYAASDGGGDITSDIPVALGAWRVFTLSLGGTNAGDDVLHFTDGVDSASYTHPSSGGQTMTGLTVGGRTENPSAVTRFNGQIAEILVYSSDLSTDDITAVQNHLLNKYIIPEPASLGLVALGALMLAKRRRV